MDKIFDADFESFEREFTEEYLEMLNNELDQQFREESYDDQ